MISLVLSAVLAGQNVQASVPNTQTGIESEVQAMNDRLLGWIASIDPDGNPKSCKTIASSGDQQLDALACQAMSECGMEVGLDTFRLQSPTMSETDKMKLALKSSSTMTTCVARRRTELFTSLAKSRVRSAKDTN